MSPLFDLDAGPGSWADLARLEIEPDVVLIPF